MGVHVVMYFYYFLSAFGPKVQKYLWWKWYVTILQLVQLVTYSLHAAFPLFVECDFPKIFSYVIIFHGAMFFLFFLNFYMKAYLKKGDRKGAAAKTDINASGLAKEVKTD